MLISLQIREYEPEAKVSNNTIDIVAVHLIMNIWWHLNIEILSRLLLLCRLTMYDLVLYRLPLIMIIASAGRN